MALKSRRLNISFTLQDGSTYTLDQNLDLTVRITKAALMMQNRAVIDAYNIGKKFRETLLSRFTAWNKRLYDTGQSTSQWANVTISAGYETSGTSVETVIYQGQVALVEPVTGMPDVGVRITCFTRQIDKSRWISQRAPAKMTYKKYAEWIAGQMEIALDCQTSYDDSPIYNPGRQFLTIQHMLIDLQDMHRPYVAAFIDDSTLYIRDVGKIIDSSSGVMVDEFIGIPQWQQWGVQCRVMFAPEITLTSALTLKSALNPQVDGQYVVTQLEYELASRNNPFYITALCSPPA